MTDDEERGPWNVHVLFIDGVEDQAIGQPFVVGDNLRIAIEDNDGVSFEAVYPLAHVRVWWCEYTHEAARKNARGRRWTVRRDDPCGAATDDTTGDPS